MAWRLAESLVVLRNEVRARWPGTTVWDIGDEDHQDEPSDHNPNPAGVVCAADFLGDAGLDLGRFAESVRTSGHPALKYVIYNRRIASARSDPPWSWRPYGGSNPHTGHVHVSVGVGPDGQSTGPYDDTTPWGVEDDMPTADEIAKATVRELLRTTVTSRVTGNEVSLATTVWGGGYESAYRAREGVVKILAHLAGQDVAEAAAAAAREAVRAEFAALGPALAAELREMPAERIEQALRAVLGSLDEPGQDPA